MSDVSSTRGGDELRAEARERLEAIRDDMKLGFPAMNDVVAALVALAAAEEHATTRDTQIRQHLSNITGWADLSYEDDWFMPLEQIRGENDAILALLSPEKATTTQEEKPHE